MTRVDLITGFLGAGKTTFIHRYLHHLDRQSTLIIENEFGSVGVDARFLQDDGCEIEDLSGVCMCCRGRGDFINMLIGAAARNYERVVVEPSGIYDVDEFFSVMNDPAVRAVCEIGSIVTVVDPVIPENLSPESEYLMFTQLAASGAILLSKTQLHAPEAVRAVRPWLDGLMRTHGGSPLPEGILWDKPWDELTDEDFARLRASGFHRSEHARSRFSHEDAYGSFITAGRCRDEADLESRLRDILIDPRFGRVIRVKGYLRDLDGHWYEVNCTPGELSVCEANGVRRGVLVVIGQELNEEALEGAFLPRPEKRAKTINEGETI